MILSKRFKEIDKHRVWEDHKFCAKCGSNQNCSLHHILGTVSDSILNSIMLCYEHHKEADGHNVSDKEFQAPLLQYTIKQALKEDYKLKIEDLFFYKTNILLYNYIDDREQKNKMG